MRDRVEVFRQVGDDDVGIALADQLVRLLDCIARSWWTTIITLILEGITAVDGRARWVM